MLKSTLSLYLTLLFLCTLFSCKKDSAAEQTSHLSVKIDGEFKETTDVMVYFSYDHTMTLVAKFPAGDRVDLLMTEPGSNDPSDALPILYYSESSSPLAVSTQINYPSIQISNFSKIHGKLSGTFSGTLNSALKKMVVTEGKFDAFWSSEKGPVVIPVGQPIPF